MNKMKRVMIVAVVLATAVLVQGCAVFYGQDKTNSDGSTEREFGLLGGCLPLWRYRSLKSVSAQKPDVKKETPAYTTEVPKP